MPYTHQNPVRLVDPDGNMAQYAPAAACGPGVLVCAGVITLGTLSVWALTPSGQDSLKNAVNSSSTSSLTDTYQEQANKQDITTSNTSSITTTDASTISKAQRNDKETQGSYTITFDTGKKYHGKGPVGRMLQSAAIKSGLYKTTPTSFNWSPASSSREAHKDEYKRMQTDAILPLYPEGKDNPMNYNILQSWGKGYCAADGDC